MFHVTFAYKGTEPEEFPQGGTKAKELAQGELGLCVIHPGSIFLISFLVGGTKARESAQRGTLGLCLIYSG